MYIPEDSTQHFEIIKNVKIDIPEDPTKNVEIIENVTIVILEDHKQYVPIEKLETDKENKARGTFENGIIGESSSRKLGRQLENKKKCRITSRRNLNHTMCWLYDQIQQM